MMMQMNTKINLVLILLIIVQLPSAAHSVDVFGAQRWGVVWQIW